ncbi:MAG: T9SS type A sorting domain-containing protein [Cytophagales bacterium]|nr:T9SS type A sorting domain-containing protein [Cytophagales bacterium]
MKKSKNLKTVLAAILVASISTVFSNTFAQIDSIIIKPSNPTTSDSIIVIGRYTFNSANIMLGSNIIFIDTLIEVRVYFDLDSAPVVTGHTDTITIGKLSVGNYKLIYYLIDTTDSQTYSDTIYFAVSPLLATIDFSSENSFDMQIYPNPFTYKTKIKYNLPDNTTDAALTIYNIVGEKIKEYKLNDKKGELIIDSSDLTQGLYMLYIKNDQGFVSNKRMLIIR